MNNIFLHFFIKAVLITFSITIIFLLLVIVTNKNKCTDKSADFIIILGHALDDDQNPSDWLSARLNTGLALYKKGYASKIVVTGGKGPRNDAPVALTMKIWLVENGVSEKDIIIEDKSKNTFENFSYSSKLISKDSKIICVTSDFHMFRSILIGEKFFSKIYGCSSHASLSLNKIFAYIKEPFSTIRDYFKFDF